MTEIARSSPTSPDDSVINTTDPGDTRHIPGQPDMWAFVLFETAIFTGYFGVYLFNRSRHPDAFIPYQAHLDLRFGVFNTIVLLLSSWTVARCVQAARAGAYRRASTESGLTALFGVMFFTSKVFEWEHYVKQGDGVTSSEFFNYYFFLTGIHCLHLLIGFVVLGIVIYQLRSPARQSQEIVETGATYWHTVDFLWVLIFALLYVVR